MGQASRAALAIVLAILTVTACARPGDDPIHVHGIPTQLGEGGFAESTCTTTTTSTDG